MFCGTDSIPQMWTTMGIFHGILVVTQNIVKDLNIVMLGHHCHIWIFILLYAYRSRPIKMRTVLWKSV